LGQINFQKEAQLEREEYSIWKTPSKSSESTVNKKIEVPAEKKEKKRSGLVQLNPNIPAKEQQLER